MSEFYVKDPKLENYWRAIILFGRNTASYKFALAKSLIDVRALSGDLITLETLSQPFAKHICEHLHSSPKQGVSSSSRFLDVCREFNSGNLPESDLVGQTAQLGFVNVIDAFHTVGGEELPERFFIDERKTHKGIRITENFYKLAEGVQFKNFEAEVEARWRLVEESWASGVARTLLDIDYDEGEFAYRDSADRRIGLVSARDSLNGYQKGKCFYCYADISVYSGDESLGDVDHFLPFMLRDYIQVVNGVWNLVLACKSCNRGENGKFAKIPKLKLLERLHTRNEYFISSHLPLREALIRQTGQTEQQRKSFLQQQYQVALNLTIIQWEPEQRGDATF